MLVFDYKCKDDNCGKIEERMVKNTDTFQFCSKCGCEMKKLLSAPAMIKGNSYGDKCGSIKPR